MMKKTGDLRKSKFYLIFFIIIFIVLLSFTVLAQKTLPVGLQKIIDYNNQMTLSFATKIGFFVAFFAGLLGILSPCILPFLPAYFSYTFKEKKNITFMTFIFFLGFSLVFVTLGVIAGFLGQRTLAVLQSSTLVLIAGLFMVALGLLSLSGKGISSFISRNRKFSNDWYGTFLFGMFFAFGWTACLGPILGGILGIGALLHNPISSGILLFFYSFGNLVPLFILSMLYDKYHLERSFLLKGKMYSFKVLGKYFAVHTTNIISGILFILIGAFLVIFRGTGAINGLDLFGTAQLFYDLQRKLVGWDYAKIVSILSLIIFTLILARFMYKNYVTRKR